MLSKLSILSLLPHAERLFAAIDFQELASFGVLIVLVTFLGLEARAVSGDPGRRRVLRGSIRANLALLVFNDILLSLLSVSTLLVFAEQHSRGGLLSAVRNPAAHALLAFVLLDLSLYAWHWANHRFDRLWMFHRVHHSDLSMNVTTAFRLHFVEILLTTLIKAVFIAVTGVNAAMVLINEGVMALFVMFHHTGFSVPGERWLGRLIVVPSQHRVHHSQVRQEHDHNYGAVFSIWDRVFGTSAECVPARLGLRDVGEQDFLELLKFGFTPMRPTHPNLTAMIAEAAYFKAEKRGFAPGMEMLDWLDAEREITGRAKRLF